AVRETLEFLMYDWLKVEELSSRDRYAAHSRDVFDSVLDVSEKIAAEKFGPLNCMTDLEEPEFVDGEGKLPEGVGAALAAYGAAGLLAAGLDEAVGAMQLPNVIDMAANTFFTFHSSSLSAYAMLSYANANLLTANGSDAQKREFALPPLAGRYFGTM